MATAVTAEGSPRRSEPFPGRRPTDYDFFLSYVVLIWLAVLAGFGPDIVKHLRSNAVPYPLAVHVHAVVTVAWLALLTNQVLLIRRREVRLSQMGHRRRLSRRSCDRRRVLGCPSV